MTRRLSRRRLLAAVGTVALAGCSGENRFWDDPPAFDATNISTVTDEPVPAVDSPLPVTVGDRFIANARATANSLLETVPDPLTADILPNGVIRQRIQRDRQAAESALTSLRSATAPLNVVDAAAAARGHAAGAAAAWATVSANRAVTDLPVSQTELRTRVRNLRQTIPDVAPTPAEGAVVYGALEALLWRATEDTLQESAGLQTPLTAADTATAVNTARTSVAGVEHLYDRYLASLDGASQVWDELLTALDSLSSVVRERSDRLRPDDPSHLLFSGPNVEALVDRDIPPDHPGEELITSGFHDSFERLDHVAWPGGATEYSALSVRDTHQALAVLATASALIERLDEGEAFFPSDASALRTARGSALDAIRALARADSPLSTWAGRELARAISAVDRDLRRRDVDAKTAARVYGQYVWLAAVASRIPAATEKVESAFRG